MQLAPAPVPAGPAPPAAPDPDRAWLLDPDRRRTVRVCVTTLATLSAFSLTGVTFWFWLVNHQPLLLVAMSPIGRHLLLVAPTVDPYAFVTVVVLRRMLFYMASFHLGRALGPAGISWIEARARRFGRFVRLLERVFRRASAPIVFVFSGPTISALAGVSGMRPRTFAALAASGLVVRAITVLAVAVSVRGYIEILLAWIDEHWVPGTIAMLVLVGLYLWRRRAPSPWMED